MTTQLKLIPNVLARFSDLINGQALNTSLSSRQIETLWQPLVSHYTEAHRHYHDLSHIAFLFKQFDSIKPNLIHPDSVALAIFYHDVIYDTQNSSNLSSALSNERQSANFMQQQLDNLVPQSLINQAFNLILLTEKHELNDDDNHDFQNDARYFLDMDLSILGQSDEVYEGYAKAVRLEYAQVPDELYRQGRMQVLTNFLNRPRLYFTDYFYDRFEQMARTNLEREIKNLSV